MVYIHFLTELQYINTPTYSYLEVLTSTRLHAYIYTIYLYLYGSETWTTKQGTPEE
jgi:hypothetical protein